MYLPSSALIEGIGNPLFSASFSKASFTCLPTARMSTGFSSGLYGIPIPPERLTNEILTPNRSRTSAASSKRISASFGQ